MVKGGHRRRPPPPQVTVVLDIIRAGGRVPAATRRAVPIAGSIRKGPVGIGPGARCTWLDLPFSYQRNDSELVDGIRTAPSADHRPPPLLLATPSTGPSTRKNPCLPPPQN